MMMRRVVRLLAKLPAAHPFEFPDGPWVSRGTGASNQIPGQNFTHRIKVQTGVTGVAPEPKWRSLLQDLYGDILKLCRKLPEDAPYRLLLEEVHTRFLDVLETTDDYQVMERVCGMGPVELMIHQGVRDLELLDKYIAEEWWKPLPAAEQIAEIEEYSKSIDGRVGKAPGLLGRMYEEMQRSIHAVHPDIQLWRLLREHYPMLKGSSVASGSPPAEWTSSRSVLEWQKVLDGVNATTTEARAPLLKYYALESQLFQVAWETRHPTYRVSKAPWVRELFLTITPEDFRRAVEQSEYLEREFQVFPLDDVPQPLRGAIESWAAALPKERRIRRTVDPFTDSA
jgi:hypothetical protein